MKIPQKILKGEFAGVQENTYTEYKFNKKIYKDCYEYIHFWKNGEGKWKCFKIYLEKGNNIWYAWTGKIKWTTFKFIGEIEA